MDEKIIARFWKKVDRGGEADCWLWVGALNEYGYGVMSRPEPGKHNLLMLAHRVSWAIHNGGAFPTRETSCCHTCDVRRCVNPRHIFLGTRAENLADMRAKGRGSPPPILIGEANPATPFTADIVREIRRRHLTGETQTSIARIHGVSQTAIHNIVHGRTWRHLL